MTATERYSFKLASWKHRQPHTKKVATPFTCPPIPAKKKPRHYLETLTYPPTRYAVISRSNQHERNTNPPRTQADDPARSRFINALLERFKRNQ